MRVSPKEIFVIYHKSTKEVLRGKPSLGKIKDGKNMLISTSKEIPLLTNKEEAFDSIEFLIAKEYQSEFGVAILTNINFDKNETHDGEYLIYHKERNEVFIGTLIKDRGGYLQLPIFDTRKEAQDNIPFVVPEENQLEFDVALLQKIIFEPFLEVNNDNSSL